MGFACVVGYITIIALLALVAYFIYAQFIVQPNMSKYGAKTGAWALITGAREGIGRGFAETLASQGFNVVLTARNESGLKDVAAELEKKYNVKTIIIASDAGDANGVEAVVSKVKDLDLSVLVNNVGVNTEFPTILTETPVEEVTSMINVNVTFTTLLTRALIPVLSKRRSLILCLSSFTGRIPVPMMAVYSATKAYNEAFATALAGELAPLKIDVKSIIPHYVVSAMSGFRKATLTVPAAKPFAARALAQVQLGTTSLVPHWAHQLHMFVAGLLPDGLVGSIGLSSMKQVRAALIKRKERNAAKAAAQTN